MQDIELLFIITSISCFVAMLMANVAAYLLFKLLKKKHTSYYRSIGEPGVIILDRLSDTEEEFIRNNTRRLKGGWYVWRIVFEGVPKEFPKNAQLRKRARAVRVTGTIALILWVMVVTTGYLFYESSK